ncbi:MAG: germination protein YpeB [Clostridia bacterium]|nr:germination protein YpeB [Clostridia bacterium]
MKKWIICIALGVLILTLIISLSSQMRRAEAAEHTLQESTLFAVSETAEELQALSLAMDKLTLSADALQRAELLHQAVLFADRARHSLSALPASQELIAPVLDWLSHFSGTLASHLSNPSAVSDDLSAMVADLRLLHAELDLARQELLSGKSLTAAFPSTALTSPPTAAELVSYRGLPSQEIGSGQALQIAKEFVGESRVAQVAPAPDTSGALPAFGVIIQTSDVQLNLEITQRGGKVLLMSPETASFPVQKSVEDCTQAAADFLRSRGFASMSPMYTQLYDGLCVLTFVHVQDGVLVWPDRVLVQVRMDTAEVVGIEARNYWKNHTPRKLSAPLLTAEEARAALSPHLTEQSVRPALLPVNNQERLCWQFTVAWADDTYIIFIDAITGREVLLEKVMQLEAGSVAA